MPSSIDDARAELAANRFSRARRDIGRGADAALKDAQAGLRTFAEIAQIEVVDDTMALGSGPPE